MYEYMYILLFNFVLNFGDQPQCLYFKFLDVLTNLAENLITKYPFSDNGMRNELTNKQHAQFMP